MYNLGNQTVILKGIIIMLKIAIVGTGIIVKSHIKAFAQLDDVELVAVCDINEEKAKAFSEECGVPYFLNYKDIPAGVDCDAVILNLPHGLHCEVSEFFLDAGKHVLCENPMANSVEECKRMIAAAERNGKKLAIGHIQRFMESIRTVKKIYESGELGKLCMYTENRTVNYFADNRPRWFLDKKMAGGGVVMNYGAHAFDKLFSVMGDVKIETLDAHVSNYANDESIEGHAMIFARFDNGVVANITFSGYTNTNYDAFYYFTNGALKVNNHKIEINRGNNTKGFEDITPPTDVTNFALQLDAFHKYIKGEPTNVPDGEYGMKVIEVIEEIYKHIV